MKSLFVFLLVFLFTGPLWAVRPDLKTLPIGLAPHEIGQPLPARTELTDPPTGHARSLGEWEESEAVMILWNNADYLRKLAARVPIRIITDSENDKSWWINWFDQNQIPSEGTSFSFIPTDSIWIRDYGPWFILDGNGKFGLVDTVYNRPRPKDDEVPRFLANELGIPRFAPGLVHTGGNYYNDGLDNAFSSTLVYSENSNLDKSEVLSRMKSYLGIERYITSKLAPKITIEHIDTFGKLVAPDTFVFSEFPVGSRYRQDSENYVALLKTLKSPYGTPYKIFRMKMKSRPGGSSEDYRAYLNAFISNKALYFPTYGDEIDNEAKTVFESALPGYEVIGVDAMGTSWGDSVHCRSRNLLKKNALFVFPEAKLVAENHLTRMIVRTEIVVPENDSLVSEPMVSFSVDGVPQTPVSLNSKEERFFEGSLGSFVSGTKVSFSVEAKSQNGLRKSIPLTAPLASIDVSIP